MKRKLLFVALASSVVVSAFAGNTYFYDKKTAKKNCPSTAKLYFTPYNLSVNNSAGTITSTFRGKNFGADDMTTPKNLDDNGVVSEGYVHPVAWREVCQDGDNGKRPQCPNGGYFGYQADNGVTSCYYYYENWNNTKVHLILTSSLSSKHKRS